MYVQKDKLKMKKSRMVVNTVVQKKRSVKQGFGLVENFPVIQRVYNFGANGYTAYNNLWRCGPANAAGGAQQIRYVGKADEFNGGGAAGGHDFTNVMGYQNSWGDFNGNSGAMAQAAAGTAQTNQSIVLCQGHLLPQMMGGSNGGNCFAQNMGENGTNPWRSDENTASGYMGGRGASYSYYQVDLV